jgi:predicted permease
MITLTNLLAKLDYPPAPVMIVATLACAGFIFLGGFWFKRADERAKAERAALKAAATSPTDGTPTNP